MEASSVVQQPANNRAIYSPVSKGWLGTFSGVLLQVGKQCNSIDSTCLGVLLYSVLWSGPEENVKVKDSSNDVVRDGWVRVGLQLYLCTCMQKTLS